MKHTTAAVRATLASIDATLRLTETALWEDPEFQKWEAGQVSDEPYIGFQVADFLRYRHAPGPDHWLAGRDDLVLGDTVCPSPMIEVVEDHDCICETTNDPEWRNAKRITPDEYPDTVTHGPLLLGPEPGPVRLPADVVPA